MLVGQDQMKTGRGLIHEGTYIYPQFCKYSNQLCKIFGYRGYRTGKGGMNGAVYICASVHIYAVN